MLIKIGTKKKKHEEKKKNGSFFDLPVHETIDQLTISIQQLHVWQLHYPDKRKKKIITNKLQVRVRIFCIPINPYLNFNIIKDDTTDEPRTSSYSSISRYRDIWTNLYNDIEEKPIYKFNLNESRKTTRD